MLHEILSRLPSTKDAIGTGALSDRWKHLWTLLPTLIFIHNDDNHDFYSIVDKSLSQCRQLKLKTFEVNIGYYNQFESQVNIWIRYAIRCNVEEINLLLWSMKSKVEFPVDQSFFIGSSFTDLTLEGCMFKLVGAIIWKNLRRLCIFFENLDESLIENILSGSPQLETLVLNDCYGYKRLNITSKSVNNLVISGYIVRYDFYEDIIEINAPKILSLKIEGCLELWKILLLNVSSLVKADLAYNNGERAFKEADEEMLKGLILNIRHVKELEIGVFCFEVVSLLEAKGFVTPSNIKFPDVSSTL